MLLLYNSYGLKVLKFCIFTLHATFSCPASVKAKFTTAYHFKVIPEKYLHKHKTFYTSEGLTEGNCDIQKLAYVYTNRTVGLVRDENSCYVHFEM